MGFASRRWGSSLAQTVVSRPMDGLERKVLNRDTLNPHLIKAQYAVRGELAIRAEELREVRLWARAGSAAD